MSKETTLKATVTEYVWTNPHVEVGVSTNGGTTTELLLELALRQTSGTEDGRAER